MFQLWINQVVGFYQQNVTLPQVVFKHFTRKNQLSGFYISGTLVENGLRDCNQNLTSNIKQIWVNQLTFIPPKIVRKLPMISMGIVFN